MQPIRGFEVVTEYADREITLPERKTTESAGYDIESAADVELLPGKVTLVPTGLETFHRDRGWCGYEFYSGHYFDQRSV